MREEATADLSAGFLPSSPHRPTTKLGETPVRPAVRGLNTARGRIGHGR